jgi:hypothetical protein
MRFVCIFLAGLLITPAAIADEVQAEVAINGMRNPELKRYRIMSAGLDAFDEHQRKLAPAATLKFQLKKNAAPLGAAPSWDGTTLRLAGNESSHPVPVGADGLFTLPRNQLAYDDDADLVLNHPKGSTRFAALVRTEGVPENAIRLGDERLECEVEIAIAKQELNFMIRAAITSFLLTTDWCSAFNSKKYAAFYIRLKDWALSATRSLDGKREPVPVRGRDFLLPFGDATLSNDTLYEFEYWSNASVERKRQFIGQWPIGFTSSADKWKSNQALDAKGDGMYSLTLNLKAGKPMFTLSSPKGEFQLGASAQRTVLKPEGEASLTWHGRPLQLDVPRDGNYLLSLDLRDLENPLLKLTPVLLQ